MHKLKARKFSIESNLIFGHEFLMKLEKLENNQKLLDEFRALLQEQQNYKQEVSNAIEKDDSPSLDRLLSDKRSNAFLRRMNELKTENDFKNININIKVDDLTVEASNIMKQVDNDSINIAMIGNRGMGKSSFINSFFDISNYDEKAIKTDETECTLEPKMYKKEDFSVNPSPGMDKIRMWDYPGVGTDRFPLEEYKEIVVHLPVDAFMFLYHPRFSESDGLILNLLKEKNKPFFVIRTKADQDIKLEEIAERLDNDNEKIEKELKGMWPDFKLKSQNDESVKKFLADNKLEESKFYFISCLQENRNYFDFPLLMIDLLSTISKEKVANLLLNLQVKSTEFFLVKHLKLKEMFPNWVKAGVLGYEEDQNSLISFMGSKIFEIHVVFGVERSLLENINEQEELAQFTSGMSNLNFTLIELKSSLISCLFELPHVDRIVKELLKKHKHIAKLLETLFDSISQTCCKQAVQAILSIE